MPELPEVETVCRGLGRVMLGRRLIAVVQRRADLRTPFPDGLAQTLTGRTVDTIHRRAKYWILGCSGGVSLIGHLGMSGRMTMRAAGQAPAPHDHLDLALDDGTVVVLNDPRRFGMVALWDTATLAAHPWLASLGPEPLEPAFTPVGLSAAIAGRTATIKALLLDQRIVAGLGNIYVCEALFRARISPRRSGASVAGARAARLVPAIRTVLTEAIAAGGSSLRDYVQADGSLGYFQHGFAVYGREGQRCPGCRCDTSRPGIVRVVQGARSTFYCPHVQR